MSRLRKGLAWTAAAGLLLALLAAVALAAADDTELVSLGASGKGNGTSFDVSSSADGRFVAFASMADNLDPLDTDTQQDVFVRDVQTGQTTLVSRASDSGPKADGTSVQPRISADGRYIVFATNATNLASADPVITSDVYRHDRVSGNTTLVSRATGAAGVKGDAGSGNPVVSADGRFVAFESLATNLGPPEVGQDPDVFLRDMVADTTSVVSRTAAGEYGNGPSSAPSISDDGRFVAFMSFAGNLVAGVAGEAASQIYRRDAVANQTILVSRPEAVSPGNTSGDLSSFAPDISADGQVVAFTTNARNLSAGDTDSTRDIVVVALQAGTNTLASRANGASGAKGNDNSNDPDIAPDGRYVGFSSNATNLTADDAEATSDVFLRDLQGGTTALVSRASGPAGPKGNGLSQLPAVASGGAFVAFESGATNLHGSDTDVVSDVFRREIGAAQPPPTPTPTPAPTAVPTATPTPGPSRVLVPEVGRTEVVKPISGVVRVRAPGTKTFRRVRAETLIKDRSEIDTTKGRLLLTVARGGGEVETAIVGLGRAIVDQSKAERPVTTLILSEPLARARTARAAASAAKRKKRRKLFLSTDGGRFRTQGNFAAATASGTAWQTTDTRELTRIDVTDGTVAVRDLVRKRRVFVFAPGSYTARKARRR